MWVKLIIVLSISFLFIFYGILFFIKSHTAQVRYDFKEDLKSSFFKVHLKYTDFFNFDENKPRRIVPVILVLGGIGILTLGLYKLF